MAKILQGFRFEDSAELRDLLTQAVDKSTKDPIMLVPFMLPHLFKFGFDEAEDSDYLTLLGIDSDLREFPLSEEFRAKCHSDFLSRKDLELASLKTHCHEELVTACRNILSKIELEYSTSQ